MSPWSKICFGIAFFCAIILGAVYFMISVWIPILYFFLIGMVASIAIAVVLDWRLYFEFFTLRTTKHGMNMGVLILLTVAALVCVNYLGARYNKTFDLTAEKLYSLSEQTKGLVNGLSDPLQITVFYKDAAGITEKAQIQKVLDLYKDFSNKVKIRYLNTYTDQASANDYLMQLPDKESSKAFAFVDFNGKRIRVEAPFDENQFTGAIVKATRRGEKKVYFLKGHGERDLDSEDPDGLKFFKMSLEGQAFKVATLNLMEKNEIPKDADFLAIVGPKTAYLEPELATLRSYAQTGGRLLVAVDPGVHHGLAGFLKSFGVEFMNNYLITHTQKGWVAQAYGIDFAPSSKITQEFTGMNAYAVFDLSSEIRAAPDAPTNLKVKEILRSVKGLTINNLKDTVEGEQAMSTKVIPLAVESTGRIDKPDANGKVTETNKVSEKDKVFDLVAFGGSVFLSNQEIALGVNRDLALNAAADLAHETDLIGSRPKNFKGNVLELGQYQYLGVVFGGLMLPILLIISSFVMWYRRRGA